MNKATFSSSDTLPYGEVLKLAWPASIAASVTPLLGTADVWALGHSTRPLDIAAVGLAAVIFSLAYWTFGFIRMSVAGLVAQAAGADDEAEARAALMRGVLLGGAIGATLLVAQKPIADLSVPLLGLGSNASDETLSAARRYFEIRIWGAPFALATYALFGWLSARSRTDYLMAASVFITFLNIALDWHFVINLDHGAAGVALGTMIAEIAGFFVTAGFSILVMAQHGGVKSHWPEEGIADLFSADKMKRTLSVNRDIFIRTLLLAASYAWFVQRGGAFGDVTLAANQTLMQLFLFTGLALDGTAIAAETLVGRAIGMKDKDQGLVKYQNAVRATFILAIASAAIFSLAYWLLGGALVGLLTPDGAIRTTADAYLPWVIMSPLVVTAGFQLDGIFIGATRAKEMRDGMIITTIVFLPLTLLLEKSFGNHGLWAAFTAYFLLRAGTLWIFMPRIAREFSKR
ncbi:MAG: MATE family efflux transporter [Parvularculaceae bacterium]